MAGAERRGAVGAAAGGGRGRLGVPQTDEGEPPLGIGKGMGRGLGLRPVLEICRVAAASLGQLVVASGGLPHRGPQRTLGHGRVRPDRSPAVLTQALERARRGGIGSVRGGSPLHVLLECARALGHGQHVALAHRQGAGERVAIEAEPDGCVRVCRPGG